MKVILIGLPTTTIDKNQVLSFDNQADMDLYFNTVIDNSGYVYEGVEAPNFIKNLWKLYNEITIFDESRIPLNVNYAIIEPTGSSRRYYFYVYDYEDLGRNQVKYYLKLDTMQSHLFNNNTNGIDYANRQQLVLREHKDRFTKAGLPIYNKTLEDVDVKPSVLTTKWEDTNAAARKLVLKKYGGGILDDKVLSQPIYAYDVHGDQTSGSVVDSMVFTMPVGWGVNMPGSSNNWHLLLGWASNGYESTTIEITDKVRNFRFVKSDDGNHYLQLISGESLTTGINILGNGAEVEGANIRLKGDGKLTLYAGFPSISSIVVHVEKDLGMYYTDPFYDRPDKRFATYDPSNRVIRPNSIFAIDYTNSKNQKVIEIPKNFNFNEYTLKTGERGAVIPLNTNLGINSITVPMGTTSFNTSFYRIQMRVKFNDPKLYHSQIRPRYLSYLSESIPLRRESLLNSTNDMHFQYKVNDSDYSKMLLYSNDTLDEYEKSEMYELSKIIDLNNEVALIKDDFSQYLDSNYRSDQRLQELQIARANRDLISSSVNQVVGIGAGIVGGAIAGNVAGAVIGGVTGTVRAVTNVVNGIKNFNQMKEELKLNYEQKIKSLQYSLINITGATPEFNELIDSNRMKLFEFSPTTEELDYLDTYFHFYGYNCLEYKAPNLKTRYHFNFIQMELVNYNVVNRTITEEVLDDIKERFRKGLTILHGHYNTINDHVLVDYNQVYENYERVLMP